MLAKCFVATEMGSVRFTFHRLSRALALVRRSIDRQPCLLLFQ